jgi:hypothetical protein
MNSWCTVSLYSHFFFPIIWWMQKIWSVVGWLPLPDQLQLLWHYLSTWIWVRKKDFKWLKTKLTAQRSFYFGHMVKSETDSKPFCILLAKVEHEEEEESLNIYTYICCWRKHSWLMLIAFLECFLSNVRLSWQLWGEDGITFSMQSKPKGDLEICG